MNSELLDAISLIQKEKNIEKEVLIEAIENSILAACERRYKTSDNVRVTMDPDTGSITVVLQKEVVEEVMDPGSEITLSDAHAIDGSYKMGDIVEVPVDTRDFGRIMTSVAKNSIVQKIRDEERRIVYDEYQEREHSIVTGVVQRNIGKSVNINLGKADAILSEREQIKGERYRPMDRIKVFLLEVKDTPKGTRVRVSRTHPDLVRCLFEEEVTEIRDGIVEIKAIAREAGNRTKIAVWSNDEDVDPVGACVGMNGARVNAVCAELGNEKIDIIDWNENPAMLIENALSPAKVISVVADSDEKRADVVVPDYQLSLAIGREGQNARLAAKLTGFKIDIKSETQARESGDFMEFSEDGFYEEEEYEDTGYYNERGEYTEDIESHPDYVPEEAEEPENQEEESKGSLETKEDGEQ